MANAWQYHLLKLASKTLCKLPYTAIVNMSKKVSPVYSFFAKKQKKRAISHVIKAFNIPEEEAVKIIDKCFDYIAQNILEVFYMPRLLDKKFIDEHIEVRGLEYMKEAIAEDKGVIVLTAHMGNWEWMGAAMASYGYPTTAIAKKQPNEQFTRFINEYREMVGIDVFARDGVDILKAARAMKKKKMLGFLADQDGGPDGLPVPFLGHMSSAVLGPATFAKRFKAPILPMFTTHKEGGGHIIHILPYFHYEDTGNQELDMYRVTELCTKVTEDFIKEYPAEWLWFQYRWKTKLEEINDWEHKLTLREAANEKV